MDELLLLRPVADPDQWEWAVVTAADGKVCRGGNDTAAAISGEAAGRETILVLPGTDVRLESVEAPPAKGNELRMAVAYLLEEQLCERVENLHFAIGGRDQSGRLSVAIVGRTLMRTWLEPLREQGIRPSLAISEALALPMGEGTPAMAIADGLILLRFGKDAGCAIEPEFAADAVRALLVPAADQDTSELRMWPVEPREFPAPLLGQLRDAGWTPDLQPVSKNGLVLFARGLTSGRTSLNLLQGDFADRSGTDTKRRWLPAVALVLLAFILHAGWTWWDLRQLSGQRTALESATESLFRKSFPEIHRIVDMQTQAEQRLQSLRELNGGHGEFLRLFGKVAASMSRMQGIRLTGLTFGDGSLDLQMNASDVKAVDALASALNTADLSARILSTESRDGRILARLRVKRSNS